jgi:hypothetical protein
VHNLLVVQVVSDTLLVVCWTPCNQPGAIVMGADPDPFIRQQILRDANGFFGGGR